jgi:hypothetical protein
MESGTITGGWTRCGDDSLQRLCCLMGWMQPAAAAADHDIFLFIYLLLHLPS